MGWGHTHKSWLMGRTSFFFCPNKNSCPVRLLDDEGLGEKLYGHEIKCGRPLPDPSPIIDCLPHITLMDQKRRSCMAPNKSHAPVPLVICTHASIRPCPEDYIIKGEDERASFEACFFRDPKAKLPANDRDSSVHLCWGVA